MTGRFCAYNDAAEAATSVQIAALLPHQISSYNGNVRNSANVSEVDMSSKILAARS
jgi:hypothetical protein